MKRLSNFFYLVSQGVKSVFKNAVMSVASLLTLLCCLLVLGSFYMIIDNIGENAMFFVTICKNFIRKIIGRFSYLYRSNTNGIIIIGTVL